MYRLTADGPEHIWSARHAVGQLAVFDPDTGAIRHRVEGVAGKVARISPDGASVVVQSADAEGVDDLVVIDMDTGTTLYTLPGLCNWAPDSGDRSHCGDDIPADATDLGWSPDGRYVAMAGGLSQRLIVWDTTTRQLEFVTDPLGVDSLSAVAYTSDGARLAVSSKTGMWIYDTTTWEREMFIPHQGRPSWVMQFSTDGTELITAQAHSGEIRIYDTNTWQWHQIEGGIGQTRDMAIDEDETMVALASRDGNIHVLDLDTGALLELISLDNRDITNIEFLSDTRLLISSATGPLEVLTLDPDELVDIARTRVSRGFTNDECVFYDLDPCPTLEALTTEA